MFLKKRESVNDAKNLQLKTNFTLYLNVRNTNIYKITRITS